MKGVKTGELVDADQLEETKKTKTGNTGLGAELRAYWKATVCEEVDIRFNAVRIVSNVCCDAMHARDR